MANVAVTKRAHLTAQVRAVENQSVVSGHSKTWFMTSTPQRAVALQLPLPTNFHVARILD